MSFLTQSHQVFFGHPLCLIPSTSHVVQRLTQYYEVQVKVLILISSVLLPKSNAVDIGKLSASIMNSNVT